MRTPELLPCRVCGGTPYPYDLRGQIEDPACAVECGGCDHDAFGQTPEEAAQAWNVREPLDLPQQDK